LIKDKGRETSNRVTPKEPSKQVRAHIYVRGLVQGVYYRQNTKDVASQNSVRGWVRNLSDGRVEAVLEGDELSVNKVIEWCRKGPPRAKVEEVDVVYENYSGLFQDFSINY
jgi:acylphosphatase